MLPGISSDNTEE